MAAMEERRIRRFGRGQRTPTLLPTRTETRTRRFTNTISCWYCDYKILAFNSPLYRFGRVHSDFLRTWFSIGVGFSLTSAVMATMILFWNFGSSLKVFPWKVDLADVSTSVLFGFSPGVYGLRMSVLDAVHLLVSTMVSVLVHEFGHAVAAASEGIQMEYVAVYIAILFPGALVAFSHDLLQNLEHFAALRVYCAGIWHNAVFCVVCGCALFLLPFMLSPFYIHGQNSMVLDVPSRSPLSGNLSPGDVIISLDGKHIHNEQEWLDAVSYMDKQMLEGLYHSKSSGSVEAVDSRKGYCISNSMIEDSKKIYVPEKESACPLNFFEFTAIDCSKSSNSVNAITVDNQSNSIGTRFCFSANEIVKLSKCGAGLRAEVSNGSNCECLQDKSCLSPVQGPGLVWAEISFWRPYSPECLVLGRNSFSDLEVTDFEEQNCGRTFVFIGNWNSVARSIQLTAYQPRPWAFFFSPYIPFTIQKSLLCTFHVSLALALLNSLPVYFLDGESIFETTLCYFSLLGPRKRAKVIRVCLLGVASISVLVLTRIFFISFLAGIRDEQIKGKENLNFDLLQVV